jgi:hypothetical protein
MRFQSGFDVVGQLPAFPQEVIREEPNLFGATIAEVERDGGPIARAFVAALPEDFRQRPLYVRSKLQWLKAGWRTASGPGGYHCDMVGSRADGSQDHVHRSQPGRHTIAAAVGDVSLTRFLLGEYELPDYPEGQRQALLWHVAIEDGIRRGTMTAVTVPEGALLRFGQNDFHTPMPAIRTGWRLFIRATLIPDGRDPHLPRDREAWNRVSNDYSPETVPEWALFAPYARG